MDLFSQNLVDFSDEQASVPIDNSTSSVNKTSEVDLFADAVFVSTTPAPDTGKLPAPQVKLHPTCQINKFMDIHLKQYICDWSCKV